jgi:hypothetical protein
MAALFAQKIAPQDEHAAVLPSRNFACAQSTQTSVHRRQRGSRVLERVVPTTVARASVLVGSDAKWGRWVAWGGGLFAKCMCLLSACSGSVIEKPAASGGVGGFGGEQSIRAGAGDSGGSSGTSGGGAAGFGAAADSGAAGAAPVCGCSGDYCQQSCGNRCVNLDLDPMNCGSCGYACSGRGDSCVDGQCRANVCNSAGSFVYLDCTEDPGCETPIDSAENCGACGAHAATAANTTPDCTCDGPCDTHFCRIGFGNCDHSQPDCETAYMS